MNEEIQETSQHVLSTWFDLPHKDERDDVRVRNQLKPYYERARSGEFEEWKNTDHGRLALIILFDQVPRHLFRDEAEQYATDHRAETLAT
ncbi:MAG: DUF924 family protein, partial [bacterium]